MAGLRQVSPGPVRPIGPSVVRVGVGLAVAFALLAAGAGYWQVFEAAPLTSRPDNPAAVAAARGAVRGRILDRSGTVLATSRRDGNGEPYRVYTDPAMSPVLGYASARFGTAGLERAFDTELIGLTRPDPVRELLKKFDPAPYDPQALQLSLSLELQRAAVAGLGSDPGAVVMLDPRTGEVLAMASTPTFDASAIADPATAQGAFASLQGDGRHPLLDRAVQGQYVPGSVFKIVTAIAGLGSGAITPSTTYPEQPAAEAKGLLVDGFRVQDGHHPSSGSRALDLVGATEVSCNIWYALTGLKVGGTQLAAWAARLGFGAPIPFDLPTSASQVTNGGGSFGGGFADAIELASASYGQGETLVTPLQMALVAAAIANRGVIMKPYLVTSFTGSSGSSRMVVPEAWRTVLTGEQAAAIATAMTRAVESRDGQAFTAGARVPGMQVAGKSGTAQLGGTGEPNSWFIGYAPADHPQVAIAVIVEHGGRGGERAAPLAGQLLRTFFSGLKP